VVRRGRSASMRTVVRFSHSSRAWWPGRITLGCSTATTNSATSPGSIRNFHDAVADFVPPPDARWQALIPADGDEIVANHDLAPWNLVVNEQQWVFLDWDVAAPGTRLWDLAYAMHGFVPLSADTAHHRDDAGRRLRLIADAYGLDEAERIHIVPLLARRASSMHAFLADQAAQSVQPWARLWQEGHGYVWRADAEYMAEREQQWRQALLA